MTDRDNLPHLFTIHELNNPFIRVAVSVDKKAHVAGITCWRDTGYFGEDTP
jgi:uncharacterized protein YuzE